MIRPYTPLMRAVAGAVVAAVYAIAGQAVSAQDTTATSTSTTAKRVPRTTATPEMIEEAVQRSRARRQKFLSTGVPERFGSEEPFTFNGTAK
jgi:hypothetical protein